MSVPSGGRAEPPAPVGTGVPSGSRPEPPAPVGTGVPSGASRSPPAPIGTGVGGSSYGNPPAPVGTGVGPLPSSSRSVWGFGSPTTTSVPQATSVMGKSTREPRAKYPARDLSFEPKGR